MRLQETVYLFEFRNWSTDARYFILRKMVNTTDWNFDVKYSPQQIEDAINRGIKVVIERVSK